MERFRLLSCSALLAAASAGLPAAAAPPVCTVVFAHYYPWWNPADVSRFTLRPERGWYNNQWGPDAKKTVQAHMTLARSAGLAGFAFEWIGRASPSTNILLDTFIPANNNLPPDGRVRYCLTVDCVIWAMERKLIKTWSEPIPLSAEHAADLAEDLAWATVTLPAKDPNFARQYLHIDGKPVVYVYSAHSLGGAWEEAVAKAREKAKGRLYLAGDFELYRTLFTANADAYRAKAAKFDAVTNFTPLNGYPGYATSSIEQFLAEGEMDAVLDNGAALAGASAAKQYFPGITTQYFKAKPGAKDGRTRDAEVAAPSFVMDKTVGYLPLALAKPGEPRADLAPRSREAIRALLDKVLSRRPALVFINSWNEPEEGTMIEPTVSPNPAGYVMGGDFLRTLATETRKAAGR